MLIEKRPCKKQKFLVGITLLTYLIFPCYQSFGATFSSELDSFSLSNLDIDNEAFLEENKKNWQQIARQIIASSNGFGDIDLVAGDLSFDRSSEDATNQSLTVETVVEAFRQIRLGNNLSSDRVSNVPTLPQVSSADVYKGVYDFGNSETESDQPTNTFVFNAPRLYAGSPNRSSVEGFSNAGFRSVSALGNNSTSGRASTGSPGSLISLPQSQGMKALVSSFRAPSFDAQLAMMPQNNVLGALSRLEENATVGNVLGVLNSFGQLKVNVDFQTMPKMTMPTPLNLKDDFVKTSDLIGRKVQLTSALQTEVQQQVAQQAQQQLERQQKNQQNHYQRFLAQQKRQEELQKKRLQKQKEQQQKQLERYIERQKRLQEKYLQQMEKQ